MSSTNAPEKNIMNMQGLDLHMTAFKSETFPTKVRNEAKQNSIDFFLFFGARKNI